VGSGQKSVDMKKNKIGNKAKGGGVTEPEGNVTNASTEAKGPEPLEAAAEFAFSPRTDHYKTLPSSRLRRFLPDVLKVAGAFVVVVLGLLILLNPPLVRSDSLRVTYMFNGNTYTNAVLYRPLAMPTRYYIELPEALTMPMRDDVERSEKTAVRYRYFAVDRRREVAALMTNELNQTFLGVRAIKRGDPLGMDLEFRNLEGFVWNVQFLPEAILFSNAVLTVRLDVK
jgi:hypothetical protein